MSGLGIALGIGGLASNAIGGIFSFGKKKEAQRKAEEAAAKNLAFQQDYATSVFEQRQEEIGVFEQQSDTALGRQQAALGSTGVSSSGGSALLQQISAETNVAEDIESMQASAQTELDFAMEQAELNYQQSLDQADALGFSAGSSLISAAGSTALGYLNSPLYKP